VHPDGPVGQHLSTGDDPCESHGLLTERVAARHDELDRLQIQALQLQHRAPSGWTVNPAEHDWTLEADADDWGGGGSEGFSAPVPLQ